MGKKKQTAQQKASEALERQLRAFITAQQQATQNQLASQQLAGLQQNSQLTPYQNMLAGAYGGSHCGLTCSVTMATAIPGAQSYRPLAVPEPIDIPHDGLRLGEITGWRSWRVRDDFLMSLHVEEMWPPGHAMTGKPEGNGASNLPGIYAWKESRHALKHMLDTPTAGIMVCGSVELWGDIIEHQTGYRASFAKPKTLDWLHGMKHKEGQTLLEHLRQKYGISAKEKTNGS